MNIKTIFLLLLLTGFCACATTDEDSPLSPTHPETPKSTLDTLIAMALRWGFIDERVIAGSDTSTLVVLESRATLLPNGEYTITPGALPATDSVAFVLLSPEELQSYVNRNGDIYHALISRISVTADSASIMVSSVPRAHDGADYIYLAGYGCEAIFHRINGKWIITATGVCWMS